MEINIYKQSGTIRVIVSPADSSATNEELMSDTVLTLSFTHYEYIRLKVNDYVDFLGKRYWLLKNYRPVKKSSIEYQYDVKFYGIESKLKKALVLKMVDGDNSTAFSLNDSPAQHLQLIVDNMNRITGSAVWRIGQVVDSENVNIEYDCISCFDGLGKLAETVKTEWWVEGYTMNLCRCEHGDMLELGYGKGLLNVSKDSNDNVPFFTRLYPIGSTRNIDPKVYGSNRLRLPGGARYVEQNTDLGIVEYSEEAAFQHIYPRRIGHVGVVRHERRTIDGEEREIYFFTDPELPFNPDDYQIAGKVLMMKFQSGELNGQEFEVNWHADTKEFEIINQYPYENQQLPGGKLIPHTGDECVLYNLRMPEEYYPLAEEELADTVAVFLKKYSIDTAVYKAPTDYIYFAEREINLKLGRRVRLYSEYFDSGYQDSRVVSISRKLNNPTEMNIGCSLAVSSTKQRKMENNITEIQAAFKEQLKKDVLQVLKSWDSADPSEYNVFSARRSMREFLLKNQPDEAKAYINFQRALGVCGKLFNDILRVGDKLEASNQSVYSSLRTDKEIEAAIEELGDIYLRKDIEDTARELIHFLKGIDVKGAGVFHDSLNSPDFLSGFLNGKGWAILIREVMNVAGAKEKKSYAEFDEVTIRGALRVFEMIINQLKGEGDNSVFSGMMKVDHVDLDNKKIFLDTGGGLLYNPFWVNDCLECQRYGGRPSAGNDYNVTKHYELVVSGTGMGSDSDGENRLDWITYNTFSGNEADIKKGDVLVRMDNLTNPDRKGIIMNTTVGAFAPYIDVLYGAKTDPDDAVKSRVGNLAGIYNTWFGWLKGFGAFIQNLYAIGEFHFQNGENIQTRLDMMENLFRVDMQNKAYNMSEKDNFLKNASFTENMDGWQRENVIRAYTAGGKLLMFNRNLFAEKEKVASIVNLEGRNVLRIKNSGIRQANADVRKPEPATSVLYLTFKYICKSAGTLTVGFEGSAQGEGRLPFVQVELAESIETESLEYTGTWDGVGDFVLKFTGDVYIDVLALTNRPLDDFKIEVGTKFEQTAEKIALLGERIDHTNKTVTDLGIELNAAKESIRLWGEKTDKINATVTQIGLDLDMTREKLDLYVKKTDDINNSVADLGLRMKAAEGELELFSKFENKANGLLTSLGTRMNSAEGTLETYATRLNNLDGTVVSLGTRMNVAEGTLETYATRLNSLNGTTISLGNRMSAAEGTLNTYVNKTNTLDGSLTSLGTRMNAVEKKFTNYVLTDTFRAAVGDINVTLNRHWSAIEQTDRNLLLSINKSTGYPLNKDIKFLKGLNGISRYNNSGGETVTVKRLCVYSGNAIPSGSNYPAIGWTTDTVRATHVGDVFYNSSSGKWYSYTSSYTWQEGTPEFGTVSTEQEAIIRIKKIAGSSSPGLGGFTFNTQTRANAVFEVRFTAKIPTGYQLNFASNATGNNSRTMWITDSVGTDGWKEYRYQVFCGDSGSFSTTNFFYLTKDVPTGQTNDDYNTTVTWYLKEATVFDLSGYEDPVTYINLTEDLAKIKAKRIEFEGLVTANEYFKILEDGSVESRKGTFKNVIVQGSIRSPFVRETDSIVIGGEQSTHDNVAALAGGGGWVTAGELEWDINQSGRRMCITNYRWGNQISEGVIEYDAPSGKYFYEDGIGKIKLSLSRECVELMGYGTSTQFYGWIVLNRINLMTSKRYGRKLNVLAQGIVSGNNKGASINYKTFDGTTLSVTRNGEGIYTVYIPSVWGLLSGSYLVMLSGYGYAYNATSDIKATLFSTDATSFVVHTSDDASRNDGSFMFQIINLNDWN